jgi:hypothetical protein
MPAGTLPLVGFRIQPLATAGVGAGPVARTRVHDSGNRAPSSGARAAEYVVVMWFESR